jgi:hypothetical protein
MAGAAVIADEADLWDLMEQYLSAAPIPEIDGLDVTQWRPRLLYLPDAVIGHTITPSMARAVVGFHASLSRSYAYLAYGQATARLLKQDDQAVLDIRMLVSEGSDVVEALGEDLSKLISSLVSKMSGRQVLALSALLLLLYFSSVVARAWISEQYETKRRADDARERITLSEQETRRLGIVAEALQQHPEMKPVAELASQGREQLVRGVVSVDRSQVLGVSITGDEAKVIVSKPRDPSYGKRMDGNYEVVEIDTENPDGYMGRLRNVVTNQEIPVAINRAEIAEGDIQTLFDALRQKSTVDALVNAWFLGDKITSAAVVRADPHEIVSATNPPAAPPPSPEPPTSPPKK